MPVQTYAKLYWKSGATAPPWFLHPCSCNVSVHFYCANVALGNIYCFRINWKCDWEYTFIIAKPPSPVSYSHPAVFFLPKRFIRPFTRQAHESATRTLPPPLCRDCSVFLLWGKWLIQWVLEATTWPLLVLLLVHHLFIYFAPLVWGLLVSPFMPSLLRSFLNLCPSVLNLSMSFSFPSVISPS